MRNTVILESSVASLFLFEKITEIFVESKTLARIQHNSFYWIVSMDSLHLSSTGSIRFIVFQLQDLKDN